jgi:hypothetical protein
MGYVHKIFISLTLSLNAQESKSIENLTLINESYLTFDVFSSLNTFSPRWRVGCINGINPKWKIGLNLGYGNKNISYTYFADKFEEDYKLWEIRPELYYIIKQNQKSSTYGSVEIYYINHKDIFHDSFYRPVGGGYYSFEKADFLRQKYGFNFNIGKFINLGKWFGMNIFTGLGLKIRNNSFSNIVNPTPHEYHDIDMYDTYEYGEKEGLDYGLNYFIGLKLLFR